MIFLLKHELSRSRFRTKDRAVKNFTSICKVLALMAAVSSTVFAQRTSSAVQTVTFGVHRSSLSVLNNLSLVQGAVHSHDGSQASTLQNLVPTDPMKITVRVPSMPAVNAPSRTRELGSAQGTSAIRSDVGSPYGGAALVVTISE